MHLVCLTKSIVPINFSLKTRENIFKWKQQQKKTFFTDVTHFSRTQENIYNAATQSII